MCIACTMNDEHRSRVNITWGNYASEGPIVMFYLGRCGLSVGLWKVRRWSKPEYHQSSDRMFGFTKGSDKATEFKVPIVKGWMWGVFHFTWVTE